MVQAKPFKSPLHLARLEAGLSQSEICNLVNMSQNNWSRKERNTNLFTVNEKIKISTILKKDIKDVFPNEEPYVYIANNKELVQNIGNNSYVSVGNNELMETLVEQNKNLVSLVATLNSTLVNLGNIMSVHNKAV